MDLSSIEESELVGERSEGFDPAEQMGLKIPGEEDNVTQLAGILKNCVLFQMFKKYDLSREKIEKS